MVEYFHFLLITFRKHIIHFKSRNGVKLIKILLFRISNFFDNFVSRKFIYFPKSNQVLFF